jgi:hypothetical protein
MATLNAATVAINVVAGTADYIAGIEKATRSAESWERSLRSQIQTMEMGADQSKLYNLALRGADATARDNIRALLDRKAALEATAEAERKATQRTNELQNQAAMLYEQTRTPAERYAASVANLRDLLTRSAISQDTYNRALAQSRESFQQMSGAAQRAADIQKKAAEQRATAEAAAAAKIAEAHRAQQEVMARGQQVYQQTRTSSERYQATISELSRLLKAGAISHETHMRAVAQANTELVNGSAAMRAMSGGAASVVTAMGPIGVAAVAVAAVVGGVAIAAFKAAEGLTTLALEGTKAIADLVDKSVGLQMTAESLSGLHAAARLSGASAETMDAALSKMSQSLGDAAISGGPAAKAIERLGLSLEELSQLSPDKAFKSIVAQLSHLENGYERASVAQDIFGKGAANMATIFAEGADDLQRNIDAAKAFGVVIGNIDAKSVKRASDQMEKLGLAIDGIKMQLAIQFAPIFIEFGQQAGAFIQSIGGVASVVETTFKGAAIGLAKLTDGVLIGGKMYWDFFVSPAIKGNLLMLRGLNAVLDTMGKIQYVATGSEGISMVSEDVARFVREIESATKAGDELSKAYGQKSVTQYTRDFFDGIEKARNAAIAGDVAPIVEPTSVTSLTELNRALDDTSKSLQTVLEAEKQFAENDKIISALEDQIATFGMSEKAIALYKMALRNGGTVEQMKQTSALYDTLDALKQQQKMLDEGASLYEQMRTPQEKAADELERYQQLLEAGAISQETFDRASQKTRDSLNQTLDTPQNQQLAAREIRFNASIPGAKRFTDELKAPAKATAKNTGEISEATNRVADIMEDRLNFDVVESN